MQVNLSGNDISGGAESVQMHKEVVNQEWNLSGSVFPGFEEDISNVDANDNLSFCDNFGAKSLHSRPSFFDLAEIQKEGTCEDKNSVLSFQSKFYPAKKKDFIHSGNFINFIY